MAEVVDKQLAIDIGGHVVFRIEPRDCGHSGLEAPPVADQRVVGLRIDTQRVSLPVLLGDQRDHLPDARLHEPHGVLEGKAVRERLLEPLSGMLGRVPQVLAQDDVDGAAVALVALDEPLRDNGVHLREGARADSGADDGRLGDLVDDALAG